MNDKYDNLTTLMSAGWFNWVSDPIRAVLLSGATFDKTDAMLTDVAGERLGMAPVGGRVVAADGSLVGAPVTFNNVPADTSLQVVLVREEGSAELRPLAWYDTNDQDNPLRLDNHGTFI